MPTAFDPARHIDDPVGPGAARSVRSLPRRRLASRGKFVVPAHLRLLRIDAHSRASCGVALIKHLGAIKFEQDDDPLDPVDKQVAADRNGCPVGLGGDVER